MELGTWKKIINPDNLIYIKLKEKVQKILEIIKIQ